MTEAERYTEQKAEITQKMFEKLGEAEQKNVARTMLARMQAILAVDAETLQSLIETRYFCTRAVEGPDCPAVPSVDDKGNLQLGLLGVVNGLMPVGWRIVACYQEGLLVAFTLGKVEGEVVVQEPKVEVAVEVEASGAPRVA